VIQLPIGEHALLVWLHMSTAHNIQSASFPKVAIRASDTAWSLHWNELWQHRELLYFLTWRDIKVRYKQTVLGVLWVILQPLAIALALSLFLGRIVHVPAGGLPYPVFAYSGMVLWQLFAQAITESSSSVVANERLISKVYFPRLFVPLSAVLASLFDFVISLLILAVFLVGFRVVPTASLALLPFFVLLAVLSSLGAGLWLSALNVKFRDVRYVISFLVQSWFLASPIAYPTSVVPERWRLLYDLNPMVGALDGFRWAVRSNGAFPTQSVTLAFFTALVLLLTGLYYFRRTEDTFADFI
jgi:lipopolysaccharide transport system permease protein